MAESYFLPFEYPHKSTSRSHRVWVAPVSSRQQESWGTLCAVVQVPSSANADHLFRQLCDLFTKLYYPTTIATRTKQSQSDQAHARTLQFEQMLQELNEDFVNLERFGIDARERTEFDVLLALIHPDEVLIANHVGAHAWFVGANGQGPSEDFRMEQLTNENNGEDFFSSVTSGTLSSSETIVLATGDFFSYWRPERVIHQIDTAESTEELLEILEQEGNDSQAQPQAALFVLGLSPETQSEPEEGEDEEPVSESGEVSSRPTRPGTHTTTSPQSNGRQLHQAAQATVVSLAPILQFFANAVIRSVRSLGVGSVRAVRWLVRNRHELPQVAKTIADRFQRAIRWVVMVLLWCWSLVRSVLLLLGFGVATLIGHTAGKDAFAKQLEKEPAMRSARLTTAIQQQSNVANAIAIGMVLIIIAGAGAVTRLQYSRLKQLEQDQRQEIEQKITQAQGPLIYGDDTTAKSLLEQARALLDQLPDRANDPTKSQIQKELDELAQQLRHEILLPAPTVTIPAIEEAAAMAATPTTFVVASTSQVAIFDARDLARKRVPRIIKLPAGKIQTISSIDLTTTLALIHDGPNVHRIPLDGKSPMTTVALPSTVGRVRTLFNSRLYAVDAAGKQLLKLNPASNTWAKPTVWFTDPALQLPRGLSAIAVDGAVYASTDHDVVKYYQGKPELFTTTIEPPLERPQHIIAPENDPNLFVLDSKRVIVLDKGATKKERGGITVGQLVDKRWNQVQDFVVDTKLKHLIVLADGNILQYPLPTLK
ncbi:hypothetical protein HZA86_05010 [Candidatus Uhrbacteria bacterium]|nr:hypothetical protein [Candidatus Uhrbacteria bacterium]